MENFRAEVAEITAAELDAQSMAGANAPIAALLRCISRLPEKLRRVVHAGLDGMKAPALAEALGTTPGAVHQLHYRANQLLRECLAKEGRDV